MREEDATSSPSSRNYRSPFGRVEQNSLENLSAMFIRHQQEVDLGFLDRHDEFLTSTNISTGGLFVHHFLRHFRPSEAGRGGRASRKPSLASTKLRLSRAGENTLDFNLFQSWLAEQCFLCSQGEPFSS